MGQEQTAVRGESLQDNGLEGKLEPDQRVVKESHSFTHAVVTASGREIFLRFSRHDGAIVRIIDLCLLTAKGFCPSDTGIGRDSTEHQLSGPVNI
jgi:hypothetical protein